MINFYDLTLDELKDKLQKFGKERFRAEQLFRWVYQKGVTDFNLMSNLGKEFRSELSQHIGFSIPKVVTQADSTDGTRKFLMQVDGDKTIESVLIPNDDRLTLCVSSEVGCSMGCKFCFTAKMGLMRRLTPAEIVGQFVNAAKSLDGNRRITNIVFMGMGEPLDNVESVSKSINILHNQFGIGFAKRRITVSTSGIVPQIPKVAEMGVRIAISLNATTDETRSKIMPINKKYPLDQLLGACKDYSRESGEMITFEYVMLKGFNDSLEDAERIVQLTRNIPSKINLIPFNEHPESGYHRPNFEDVIKFQNHLMRKGKHVLIRRTMGRDIYAACGQLRSEFEKHPRTMSVIQ